MGLRKKGSLTTPLEKWNLKVFSNFVNYLKPQTNVSTFSVTYLSHDNPTPINIDKIAATLKRNAKETGSGKYKMISCIDSIQKSKLLNILNSY